MPIGATDRQKQKLFLLRRIRRRPRPKGGMKREVTPRRLRNRHSLAVDATPCWLMIPAEWAHKAFPSGASFCGFSRIPGFLFITL